MFLLSSRGDFLFKYLLHTLLPTVMRSTRSCDENVRQFHSRCFVYGVVSGALVTKRNLVLLDVEEVIALVV